MLVCETVKQTASDTSSAGAGSAHRCARVGAPDYRAADSSGRGADGGSRPAADCSLLQRLSAVARGDIFLGVVLAFVDVPIGRWVSDPLQAFVG